MRTYSYSVQEADYGEDGTLFFIVFHETRHVVTGDEWSEDIIASFPTRKEATETLSAILAEEAKLYA